MTKAWYSQDLKSKLFVYHFEIIAKFLSQFNILCQLDDEHVVQTIFQIDALYTLPSR